MKTEAKKLTIKQAAIGFVLSLVVLLSLVILGVDLFLALFATCIVTSIFGLLIGNKWDAIEEGLVEGGTSVLGATFVMIMVSVLVGVWMASGTIPAILYYGMKLISPALFLPLTLVICVITSVSTGTSWGTAGTIGIALFGVGVSLGIPAPMVVGAIVSGAIVGDKLSPLSDTTLLAAGTSGTKLFDHITSMLYTTVPIFLISFILYTIMGLKYGRESIDYSQINVFVDGLAANFKINPFMLIPVILVLAMSLKKVPAIPTFAIGIVFSMAWAVIFQEVSFNEICNIALNGYNANTGVSSLDGLLSRGGPKSMAVLTFTSLFCGVFTGILHKIGILSTLMGVITRKVRGSSSPVLTTLAANFVIELGAGQYTVVTLPGAAFRETYDKYDVSSAVLSRSMEDVGTMIDCVVPWQLAAIYYAGIFGVATLDYLPFTFLALLSIPVAVINAILGIGIFHTKDPVKYNPFWRRSKHLENAMPTLE